MRIFARLSTEARASTELTVRAKITCRFDLQMEQLRDGSLSGPYEPVEEVHRSLKRERGRASCRLKPSGIYLARALGYFFNGLVTLKFHFSLQPARQRPLPALSGRWEVCPASWPVHCLIVGPCQASW